MKDTQKVHQNQKENNSRKKKKDNEMNKWRLSMKEVLKGACLINGDGP